MPCEESRKLACTQNTADNTMHQAYGKANLRCLLWSLQRRNRVSPLRSEAVPVRRKGTRVRDNVLVAHNLFDETVMNRSFDGLVQIKSRPFDPTIFLSKERGHLCMERQCLRGSGRLLDHGAIRSCTPQKSQTINCRQVRCQPDHRRRGEGHRRYSAGWSDAIPIIADAAKVTVDTV